MIVYDLAHKPNNIIMSSNDLDTKESFLDNLHKPCASMSLADLKHMAFKHYIETLLSGTEARATLERECTARAVMGHKTYRLHTWIGSTDSYCGQYLSDLLDIDTLLERMQDWLDLHYMTDKHRFRIFNCRVKNAPRNTFNLILSWDEAKFATADDIIVSNRAQAAERKIAFSRRYHGDDHDDHDDHSEESDRRRQQPYSQNQQRHQPYRQNQTHQTHQTYQQRQNQQTHRYQSTEPAHRKQYSDQTVNTEGRPQHTERRASYRGNGRGNGNGNGRGRDSGNGNGRDNGDGNGRDNGEQHVNADDSSTSVDLGNNSVVVGDRGSYVRPTREANEGRNKYDRAEQSARPQRPDRQY